VSVEEAAATLGANRLRVLWHIVVPLAMPGIVAASVLVFAYNSSAFVIPFVLGAGRVPMAALLVRSQMGPLLNWPFGSAIAVVLIVLTLLALAVYRRLIAGIRRTGGA
jgi:putative spermidine/putrescine transport system permease protein